MRFYICLQNFVVIEQLAAELWRHIDFQDGGLRVWNVLPCSGLV